MKPAPPPPPTLVDPQAELALLGIVIRDPHRVHDTRLDRLVFADPTYRSAYDALTKAALNGELAGDMMTASGALERAGIRTFRSLAADAYLAAEDLMPHPLIQHCASLARRRQLRMLATGLHNVADYPTTDTADTEAVETLAHRTVEFTHTNGTGPTPWTLLEHVMPRTVDWLWSRRLPFGHLSLLDGDPGLGKTAVTLDLAARVSRGLAFPDDNEPPWPAAGVVLLNAEDTLAETLRPRLDAAGADCSRIVAFDFDSMPAFPDGLSTLARAIRHVQARLVVIDPIMALLEASVDAYRDQDVRRVLRPLAGLAAETNTAILLVRHLTKQTGPKALYRGGGSIAFAGAARSVLLLAEDPDLPDQRVLAPVKNNLSPPAAALKFGFETSDEQTLRLCWKGTNTTTADQLLAPPPTTTDSVAIQDAMAALTELLAEHDVGATDADAHRKKAGISTYAWKAARVRLGVQALKSAVTGRWSLHLP